MPHIIDGRQNSSPESLQGAKYDYDYPEGFDLKPGSQFHDQLLAKIMERARASASVMQRRFDSWNQIDKALTAYMPLSEMEKAEKEQDSRRPMSIVVPYSYAAMETILTYMVVAFLNDPIFKYEGAGPEDEIGAILLQKVIENHVRKTKVALALHTFFRDGLSYGIGAVVATWEKKYGKRMVAEQDGIWGMGGNFIDRGTTRTQVEALLHEGNKLVNIDPYLFLPDPNVPIHKLQEGEFVGWCEASNYNSILSEERDDETLFNGRYVKHIDGRSKLFWNDESGRELRVGRGGGTRGERKHLMDSVTRVVDKVNMYITLIPKEWKLGESEYPEKWFFQLAGDLVILKATPANLNHDSYPIAVCAPDFDGYSITPLSRIEITYGLQETLDWLFSSHVANVRKAINDMLIVDPYLVNMQDLENPAPGKLVRMRRAAWGRGVENAVKQLQVNDVTQNHIRDSGYIIEIINRVTGAHDGLQGFARRGSAEMSATESRGNQAGALSRLERIAKVVGLQGMYDISYLFAHHTQQLMEEDTYVSIIGEWEQVLQSVYGDKHTRVGVSPFDLLVEYDVILKDGSIPGGGFAELWIQLYQIMAQSPELAMQFDMVRVFKHIAVSLGAKNVNDFVRRGGGQLQPQMMQDEQVMRQVEKGNVIPIQGGMRG